MASSRTRLTLSGSRTSKPRRCFAAPPAGACAALVPWPGEGSHAHARGHAGARLLADLCREGVHLPLCDRPQRRRERLSGAPSASTTHLNPSAQAVKSVLPAPTDVACAGAGFWDPGSVRCGRQRSSHLAGPSYEWPGRGHSGRARRHRLCSCER